MRLRQPARCVLTHSLHCLIRTTCLDFRNFFPLVMAIKWMTPEEAFYELAFSCFLLFSVCLKQQLMLCVVSGEIRRACPSLSHPHTQKVHEHFPKSTTPSGITRFFFLSFCFYWCFKIHVYTSKHPF